MNSLMKSLIVFLISSQKTAITYLYFTIREESTIARKTVQLSRMIADIKLPCVIARLITAVIYIPANDAKAIAYCNSLRPFFSLSISLSLVI